MNPMIPVIRRLLQPENEAKGPETQFLRSSKSVPLGHVFEHEGRSWRVTWCQPANPGWLLMIVVVQ